MSRLIGLAATILMLLSLPLLADIRGYDINGKPVLLRSDGTWNYTGQPQPPGNIAKIRPLLGVWQFGRSQYRFKPVNVFLCQVTLTSRWVPGRGYALKACNGNESYWNLSGGSLVFYHRDGRASTRFSRIASNSWQGRFLLNPGGGTMHYLRRTSGGGNTGGNLNWSKSTPATCRHYATVAIAQNGVNLKQRCGFTGVLWSSAYNHHYNWCLGVRIADTQKRFRQRRAMLQTCRAKPRPPVTGTARYQGCYIDKPDRDIKGYYYESNVLTPAKCISTCRAKGFGVAATQFARQCFCGNSFGRYGKAPAKQCNYKCSGNTRVNCGGYWRNSVYRLR